MTTATIRHLLLSLLLPVFASAQTNWEKALEEAAINYADKKKDEFVEEANKKAILAIYKKVYPNLTNKSDREALRQLGTLGLNVSRINGLASDLASGDPNRVQSAGETLAVDLGKKLSDNLKDPYLRGKMTSLLGSADKIKEISTVLGSAAGGDPRAAAEYAGDLIIAAAGGANIVGFYRSAYGAMKFAKDAYVDSEIEDMYQQYREGKFDPLRLDLAGTHFALRDKIIAEREKLESDLGNIDITPELRERLTSVNEEEFKSRLLQGFEARKNKEEADRDQEARAEAMKEQANAMLSELERIASREFGDDWWTEKQWSLEKFLEIVRRGTKEDGVLDGESTQDLALMSRLLSTRLVHGEDSAEYREALDHFNQIRNIKQGIMPESPTEPTSTFSGRLTGSWSGVFSSFNVGVDGSFAIQIAEDGSISGRYSGGDSGSLGGKLDNSGSMSLKAGSGKAGTMTWTGTITRSSGGKLSGSGTWTGKNAKGSWKGSGS